MSLLRGARKSFEPRQGIYETPPRIYAGRPGSVSVLPGLLIGPPGDLRVATQCQKHGDTYDQHSHRNRKY